MKNKKMKILKNKSGFSLVEVMISVGLLSVITYIGLKQTDIISSSMTNLSIDRQIDEMHSSMIALITKKEVCSANFINPIPKTDYAQIIDENGNAPYRRGNTYLDGKVRINSIETKMIDGNPFVEVALEKLKEKANSKNITKRIPLLVDLNPAGTAILDCFSLNSSIADTVKYEVAKTICENTYGVGTTKFDLMFDDSDPSNPTCAFDGFANNLSLTCPDGESINGVGYDVASMTLTPVCSRAFTQTSCPNNWIKKVNLNGTFECANLVDHVDTTAVAFNTGDICKLGLNPLTNRVALDCIPNQANGVCNNAVTNECYEGTFSDVTDTTANHLWSCVSFSGGTTDNCSKAKAPVAINGVCDNSTTNSCSVGSFSDRADTSTNYLWSCNGANGGTNASCSMLIPNTGPRCSGSFYWLGGSCGSGCGEIEPANWGGGDCCASCSGINSFLPGTLVSMADGTKLDVINVRIGDKVMTSAGVGTITKQYIYETPADVYRMNTDNYFVTASHPFMTTQGWKSFDPESTRRKVPSIETNLLEVGDVLINEDGSYEILTNDDHISGPHKVYNFSVDGVHDFYANGYWVHNK